MSPTSFMIILLDPGHGSDTPGKRSPDGALREYAWNREIAARLCDCLCAAGVDARILAPETTDVSLKERVARVNALCSKVGTSNVRLLSIHVNAAGDGTRWMSARGWSVYTSIGNTESDHFASVLCEKARAFFADRKVRFDYSDGDPDQESNFYILKNTRCPAVLVEHFFMDNHDDCEFLLSEHGRTCIIQHLLESVLSYLRIIKCS